MYLIIGNRASSVLYNWLKANKIHGDVLMAANICETVPSVYLKVGMNLEFCDIEGSTFTPNFDHIIYKLENNKKIVVLHYNHTYGMIDATELNFLNHLKKTFPKLIIVEDRCLSIPELIPPTSCGDLILYSTGHTKVVDINYGGFCYSKDKYKYWEADVIYDKRYEEIFAQHVKKCHMMGIEADISIFTNNWIDTKVKFLKGMYTDEVKERLPISLKHKQTINSIYKEKLSFCSLSDKYQNWRFNILVKNSRECLDVLFNNGLFASNHYKSLGNNYFTNEVFKECDWLEDHVINLFNDFCYTEEQAIRTAELLAKTIKV